MDQNQAKLALFSNSVRQLIVRFNQLKQDNASLQEQLAERDAKIRLLEEQLSQAKNDYNSLKTARMIDISDDDKQLARKRLQTIIQNIDRCITLLTDKQ